jgi:hypothetical protein
MGKESMDEETTKGGFKVVDRRRFDSDGNDRDDASETAKKEAPIAKPSPGGSHPNFTTTELSNSTEPSSDGEEFGLDFSSFIMSLATQALMQLGVMEPPPGVKLTVDKEAAQQTIDILTMLQGKTKGNLDAAEERLMTEILYKLRMAFVQMV